MLDVLIELLEGSKVNTKEKRKILQLVKSKKYNQAMKIVNDQLINSEIYCISFINNFK